MNLTMDYAEITPSKRTLSRRNLLILAATAGGALLAACSGGSVQQPPTTPRSTPTQVPDSEILAKTFDILPNSPISSLMKQRIAELFSTSKTVNRGGIDIKLHGSLITRNLGANPNSFSGIATIRESNTIVPYPIYSVSADGVVPVAFRTALTDAEKPNFTSFLDASGNLIGGNVGFKVGSQFAEGIYPHITATLPAINDVKLLGYMMTYLLVKEGFSMMLMDQMIEFTCRVAKSANTNFLIDTKQGKKEALVQAFKVLFESGYAQQNVTGEPGTRLMGIADLGGLVLSTLELSQTNIAEIFSQFSLIKKTQDRIKDYNFGSTPDQIYDQTAAWCLANAKPIDYWVPTIGQPPFFKGNFDRLP